jgi:FSR family fosmidomycin resistance protein-like MFS transporter
MRARVASGGEGLFVDERVTMQSATHQVRTLWLCGMLHTFTHLYQVALLPLYLLIKNDLALSGVEQATLLVTAMMAAYYLPSYHAGLLADHWSRKKLLAWGLALNALGFILLSFARTYPMALLSVAICGLGGCTYHPAATALIAHLFPKNTGKALGLLGIGASAGFFIGPAYAGWRAGTAGWRAPILELGICGIVGAIVFAWLADDDGETHTHAEPPRERMFSSWKLWLMFAAAAFAFSLRDFTGSSMGSLGSLFLQQAKGYSLAQTGAAVSGIFLASAISNPLFGRLSDRARLRWAMSLLLVAAALVAVFPMAPPSWSVVVLVTYGFFFMASYPIVETAVMESVHRSVRGRAFGFFITIGGVVGNLAHWFMGLWVQHLGARASVASAYYPIYGALAVFILVSLLGLPLMHRLRKEEMALGKL